MKNIKLILLFVFLNCIIFSAYADNEANIVWVMNQSDHTTRATVDQPPNKKLQRDIESGAVQKFSLPNSNLYRVTVCWIAEDRANHCMCGSETICFSPTLVIVTGEKKRCVPGELKVQCRS